MPATPKSTGFSFGFSGLVHGCILSWVAFGAAPAPKEPRRNMYDELIRPHESRIIWYHPQEKLPDVASGSKRAAELRASVKAPHTVVAGPKDLPRPAQLIWMPDAEMPAPPKPQALPNVVAVAPPKIPRSFTPPKVQPAPPRPQPALQEAPSAAVPAPRNALPELAKQKALHRPFTPPPSQTAKKSEPTLTEAPSASVPSPRGILPELGGPRTLHKQFTPPVAAPVRGSVPALQEAPGASVPLPKDLPQELGEQRVLHRPFTPPSGGTVARATGTPGPALPDAPSVSFPAESSSAATLAIVGLNPAAVKDFAPPPASRPAGFSAGPEIKPGGEAAGTSTLVVPGLVTRGAPLMAGVLPIPRRDVLSSVRTVADGSAPPPAAPETRAPDSRALRITSAPDPRLEGRTVYSIAIQMPNVTSYYGSWMVWFAESKSSLPANGAVHPPAPIRKVDPKYIAAAASERVEGVVRLYGVIRRNGRVDSIALIRHLDDRLDQSAAEALEKWVFEPATRNGQPVEVDAVFEIPFRLAPRLTK